ISRPVSRSSALTSKSPLIANARMNPPYRQPNARALQRLPPGQTMLVDAIDQRAIQIEDHRRPRPRRLFLSYLHRTSHFSSYNLLPTAHPGLSTRYTEMQAELSTQSVFRADELSNNASQKVCSDVRGAFFFNTLPGNSRSRSMRHSSAKPH